MAVAPVGKNPLSPLPWMIPDRSSPSRVRFAASGLLRADPKGWLLTRGKGGLPIRKVLVLPRAAAEGRFWEPRQRLDPGPWRAIRGFGLGVVSCPCCFLLPIRKVFSAGGGFCFQFSASYPQDRRSYYLFFNYLFFTTCTCFHFARICGGTCFHFARICGLAVFPLCTWKTVPNHTSLWK